MTGSFGGGGEKNSNTKEEVMGKDNWSVQERIEKKKKKN